MRPATSVPVTTRPAPVEREGAIDREARIPIHVALSRPEREQSGTQRLDALAGQRGHRQQRRRRERGLRQQRAHLRRPLGYALGRQVGLGQRHHAAIDAEQLQDLHVLARLRHHAIVERHHQQCRIDAAGAGEHRVHEPLMARHIDEAERVGIGVAEIDGDAAPLLLGQAIGIDAGQRLHQRGLAVIDVAGGADDHRVLCHPGNTTRVPAPRSARIRAPATATGARVAGEATGRHATWMRS